MFKMTTIDVETFCLASRWNWLPFPADLVYWLQVLSILSFSKYFTGKNQRGGVRSDDFVGQFHGPKLLHQGSWNIWNNCIVPPSEQSPSWNSRYPVETSVMSVFQWQIIFSWYRYIIAYRFVFEEFVYVNCR